MFGFPVEHNKYREDPRSSRTIIHPKSMLGEGLNGLYHNSTKLKIEECHHGGGSYNHKLCTTMSTFTAFQTKYNSFNIHGNCLEVTWKPKNYCK